METQKNTTVLNQKAEPITDAQFSQEVLGSEELTLVDFWAEWCGPCKVLGPTLDQLAGEFAGKARVLKLNVDENPETAARFGIRGIPTVLFFRGGKIVEQIVGVAPKAAFSGAIERNLA